MAEAVVTAAGRAGVRRLVLNTAVPVFDGYESPVSAVPRRVREIILGGSIPAVVLQPTVYMDNLRADWALPAIAHDAVFAYPLPPDTRASWISHGTLGEYAVAAVESSAAAGHVFDIGGATAITGLEIAELLSAQVGRTVAYTPIPLDKFAAALNQAFGAPAGDDIADLYRYAADNPAALVRSPAAAEVLGVAPESFTDFVARHEWSSPAV